MNMCNLLEVPTHKRVPTPCTKDLLLPDDSRELEGDKAMRYRSAVGIAMYVSQDRADIAFTVRMLSQKLKEPTAKCWQSAQRLASYMMCTSNYATKVHATGRRLSILEPEDYESMHDGVLLEVFCDADWSGNKQTRRSMSSSSFYLNGCCIHTSCRSQRCVSLSSTESEFYALVSAACDGIYLKRILQFLLDQLVDLCMRTDNQSCRQISMKQGVSKVRHLDGRFLWVQEKTGDGTLRVGAVDGRRNPSDLGTKVPASGKRLKALLCMHDFVECIGDSVEEVGRAECEQLLQSMQNERDTLRVRRLVNKDLKSNGMCSVGNAMMVMMLSLAQGVDGSLTRREVSVQTETHWSMQVPHVAITVLAIMIALLCIFSSLSLERLWPHEVSESTANNAEEPACAEPQSRDEGRWNMCVAAIAIVPSMLCLMFMMQLKKLKSLIARERKENDRLQGVINEMDYDRIAWAEYHAKPKPAASRPAAAMPEHIVRETHVYTTLRRGKSYHFNRGCHCLGTAEEIVRLGIEEAKTRGYVPCKSCCKSSKKTN